MAGSVEGLIWAVPWPWLKGVGWADSLRSHCSITAIARAVNDDISFLLPRVVGVGWAGSRAVLRSRTVQVAGALSGAVARAEPPPVVLVRVEFSIAA